MCGVGSMTCYPKLHLLLSASLTHHANFSTLHPHPILACPLYCRYVAEPHARILEHPPLAIPAGSGKALTPNVNPNQDLQPAKTGQSTRTIHSETQSTGGRAQNGASTESTSFPVACPGAGWAGGTVMSRPIRSRVARGSTERNPRGAAEEWGTSKGDRAQQGRALPQQG